MLATLCCYHGACKGLIYFTLAYSFTLTVTHSVHGISSRMAKTVHSSDVQGPAKQQIFIILVLVTKHVQHISTEISSLLQGF